MKILSKSEYLQLVGLVTLAQKHYAIVSQCERAMEELVGVSENDMLTGDVVFGDKDIPWLLERAGAKWRTRWQLKRARKHFHFNGLADGREVSRADTANLKRRLIKLVIELLDEIARLGGTSVVISSNARLRQDGQLSADENPTDSGVAVYFGNYILDSRKGVMYY